MNVEKGVLASVILLSIAFGANAQTVRTWAATGGADSNPCTRPLPCRTFTAAINAVSDGGEVVVLDSGGYGPFLLQKSVTVLAPAGIHAAIAPTTGAAITVDLAVDQVAILRGLYLNGQGASQGIDYTSGGLLMVEDLIIHGFLNRGIQMVVATDAALQLRNTVIRNGTRGLQVEGQSTIPRVSVERCRIENQTGAGVYIANDSRVVFRNTVLSGNDDGISIVPDAAGTTGYCDVADSLIQGTELGQGIGVAGANFVLTVTNSTISTNDVGINLVGASTVYLSGSTIVENATGIANGGGAFHSRGDNLVRGNDTDVSGTITLFTGI